MNKKWLWYGAGALALFYLYKRGQAAQAAPQMGGALNASGTTAMLGQFGYKPHDPGAFQPPIGFGVLNK